MITNYNSILRILLSWLGCHLTLRCEAATLCLVLFQLFQTCAWHPRKFQRKYKWDGRRAAGLVLCVCVTVTLKKTSVKFYGVATSTRGTLTFLQTSYLSSFNIFL